MKMAANLQGRRTCDFLWDEQGGLCPVCHQTITTADGVAQPPHRVATQGGSDTMRTACCCIRPATGKSTAKVEVVKPRPAEGRLKGLSRMTGNCPVRFLGEEGRQHPSPTRRSAPAWGMRGALAIPAMRPICSSLQRQTLTPSSIAALSMDHQALLNEGLRPRDLTLPFCQQSQIVEAMRRQFGDCPTLCLSPSPVRRAKRPSYSHIRHGQSSRDLWLCSPRLPDPLIDEIGRYFLRTASVPRLFSPRREAITPRHMSIPAMPR